MPFDNVACHVNNGRLLVLSSSRFSQLYGEPLARATLAYDFKKRVWEKSSKDWVTPRGSTWQGTGTLALAVGGIAGEGGELERKEKGVY